MNERVWQEWVGRLVQGDEQAVAEFWKEFGGRLERLAARNLAQRLQHRLGPEDVVQSACRTFFRRAQDRNFVLPDSESLWRLMCAITVSKTREKVRYHLRMKRGVNREQSLAPDRSDGLQGEFDFATDEPTPAAAAEFADEFEKLMASMDDEEKQIIQFKLEQRTSLEIAKLLDCSERTVRRILQRVRKRLQEELDEPQQK